MKPFVVIQEPSWGHFGVLLFNNEDDGIVMLSLFSRDDDGNVKPQLHGVPVRKTSIGKHISELEKMGVSA